MQIKNLPTILIAVVVILIVGIILIIGVVFKAQRVKIETDKQEYANGDSLKVNIRNNLRDNICFSSCYPYYLERENGEGWKSYSYSNCLTANIVDKCIEPKNIKAFKLVLSSLEKGIHRLAVPVCINCNNQETFREDNKFYSKEFIVK